MVLWYSFILVFSYAILLILFPQNQIGKKIFLFIIGGQLIILFALRDFYTGVDILRYKLTYDWISGHDISYAFSVREEFENVGYFVFNYLLSHFGVSYQTFLAIVGVICVVPILYFIYKYSKYPLFSVVIYLSMGVYAFQFSGLKQAIAMSISLVAFEYLLQNKEKNFYISVFVAMLFHPTAIVMLPLYLILRTKKIRLLILVLIITAFVVFLFRNQVGMLAVSIYDADYLGHYESSGNIGGTAIFLLCITTLFLLFSYSKIFIYDTIESIYFRLILVSFTLQVMSSYAYAFTRINYYYLQFLPLVLAHLLYLPKVSVKNKTISNIVSFVMYLVVIYICVVRYYADFVEGNANVFYEFNRL